MYSETLEYLYNNGDCIFLDMDLVHVKKLSIEEAVYLSIYNQEKCIATTDIIAYDLKVGSRSSLQRIKRKLLQLNYIQYESAEDAKNNVIAFKNSGYTCDWCGIKTIAIQKHHYPIPKYKGGTKTVDICPNCHYEFHKIFGGGNDNE